MNVAIIVVVIAVVIALVVMRRLQRPPVVLGAEMANADEQERLHRQRHPDLRSPLPAGEYAGDASLIDPVPVDVDRELAAVCARYARASEPERQRPTADLERIGLEVRQVLLRDRYHAELSVASELPEIWFPKEARARAEQILAGSVATVSISGRLRAGEHERADAQSLHVFIVEAASDADASTLEQLAASGPHFEPPTFVLRRGRVFLLVAGRSFEMG